jgi:hypothetical protein
MCERCETLILYTANLNYIDSVPKYQGRLQSSWTHLINPSRNVVDVQ